MTLSFPELPLRSGFTYDDSDTELRLSLPITPWMPSATSLGGDIESDAGTRASFIICQRETLGLTLRFYERQWRDVQRFLETVQAGMPFTWTPDPTYRNYREYTDVILEGPAVGSRYEATPDPVFPRVLQLPIVLARLGCSLWDMREIPPPPQFALFDFSGALIVSAATDAATLIATVVGGGSGGNVSGGGGGGASWKIIRARVGTILVHIGEGGAPGLVGEESIVNYPVVGGGSENVEAGGGNPPFGAFAGASGGSSIEEEGPVNYPGGSGHGVGFAGTPPFYADAYDVTAGGGGGGAGGPGTDAVVSGHTITGGDGGPGGETPHGLFGGGGGATGSATGIGAVVDGDDGAGDAGNGGHGSEAGQKGYVVVEWMLGEVVATQEF